MFFGLCYKASRKREIWRRSRSLRNEYSCETAKIRGWTYDGEMVNGLRHGSGKYIFDDDHYSAYKGQWVMDKEHGYGQYTWNDGSTYEGEWQTEKRCGKGIYRNRKLRVVYEGYWRNDRYHGNGVLTNSDNDERQEGEWRDGCLFNGIQINSTMRKKVRLSSSIIYTKFKFAKLLFAF